MNRKAAEAALEAYVANSGAGERQEPEAWQASDLVTDLLLLFTPEDAEQILHRVQRDLPEEQADVTPVIEPAV
ncbi:hypothetical protein ACFVJK_46790 [Streptomyces sp. NPDC127172]|uniref:hypothetical protein n=1 Tax=Streptomyces sp. NPDC127172 TaxID=3345382 RepID=UPI0036261B9A